MGLFRVEYEMVIVRKTVPHVHGPCLMCDVETEYGERIRWFKLRRLATHFETERRRREMKQLRLGIPVETVGNGSSLATLESMLCTGCKAKLPELRAESRPEREAMLKRQEERRRRAKIRAELRGEFSGDFEALV